jgi:peptidoglycan/LPS O-acetylase OafA/YrhL
MTEAGARREEPATAVALGRTGRPLNPTRIPTLDGWRAIAISMVVVHHLARGFYNTEAAYDSEITRFGAFGVDVFFGLSGFLITALLLQEYERSGSLQLKRFYLRRAFRILPVYLAFLAVVTAAGLWRSGLEAMSCLLFFRNYVPDAAVGFLTQHLWSLTIEEHFYFLWPGLLSALLVITHKKAKPITVGLALAFGLWRMYESQMSTPLFPLVPQHFRSDLRMDALLWGCAVAFLFRDPKELAKFRQQMKWPVWIVMLVAAGMCVYFYSPLTTVIFAALVPILLMGTAVNPEWALSRVLEVQPVVWLGRISYGLYLWQQLFLIPGWEHSAGWLQVWPGNLLAALGVAALSYYVLETPLIQLGRRVSRAFDSTVSE